jgi:hypothetical protein
VRLKAENGRECKHGTERKDSTVVGGRTGKAGKRCGSKEEAGPAEQMSALK